MNLNTYRIIFTAVLTLPAKITIIFEIIVQNSKTSRLEQAKIVWMQIFSAMRNKTQSKNLNHFFSKC